MVSIMATRGDWNSVWANFDQRRKAKANDGGDEGLGADDEGPDMFGDQAAAE